MIERHAAKHVRAYQYIKQTASCRPFVSAWLTCVGNDDEGGCIVSGWQHGTDKLESFKIVSRFLITRCGIPWIENNYFWLKLSNFTNKLCAKILAFKTHSKRRWRINSYVIFESVAVQFCKFFSEPKKTILGLNNHRLESAMHRQAKPVISRCSRNRERD